MDAEGNGQSYKTIREMSGLGKKYWRTGQNDSMIEEQIMDIKLRNNRDSEGNAFNANNQKTRTQDIVSRQSELF